MKNNISEPKIKIKIKKDFFRCNGNPRWGFFHFFYHQIYTCAKFSSYLFLVPYDLHNIRLRDLISSFRLRLVTSSPVNPIISELIFYNDGKTKRKNAGQVQNVNGEEVLQIQTLEEAKPC